MCHLNRLLILAILALCGQQFPAWARVNSVPYVVSYVGRTTWSKDVCLEKARKVLESQHWDLSTHGPVTLNPSVSVFGSKLNGPLGSKKGGSTVQVRCDYPMTAVFFLASTGGGDQANTDLRTLLTALGCNVTGAQCGAEPEIP
jgi:hypothetical protein